MDKTPADRSRRRFLQSAGVAGAAISIPAVTLPLQAGAAQSGQSPEPYTYGFLKPAEVSFIEAAVARLIPSDDTGPGAIEAAVPRYIDKQLGGAFGVGARFYSSGPFHPGTKTQGYQLPFTPAEFFRKALRTIDSSFAKKSTSFAKLSAKEQDAYLESLQKGEIDLDGIPGNVFFDRLLTLTIQGYFADPVYGGNRDMVAWTMIGFPGAYADFYALVDKYGIAYNAPPISLAEDAQGRIHLKG
jgi:gluconate 2-dehydrogenase gamma chain